MDWYCPECKIELCGQNVTFEERCDLCGTEVISAEDYSEVENDLEIMSLIKKAIENNIPAFTYSRYAGDRFPIKIYWNELLDQLR